MNRPRFSILMCVHNAADTINTAIRSCLEQECENWELLIWDNASQDQSRQHIENYAGQDSRIRYFYSAESIGWQLGTSRLLPEACGDYMTFLAADDYFISPQALSMVDEVCLRDEEPPIVFVRHVLTEKNADRISDENTELDYSSFRYENALEAIGWLADNWYYNSMFHFVRVDHLRQNNIDFYSPYHADNEGMTMAVLCANRFSCLENNVYVLTTDTSQTNGRVSMLYNVELNRWKYVREYMQAHGYYDEEYLRPIAYHFSRVTYGLLGCICDDGMIIDECMNTLEKTDWERLRYVQSILETDELNELHFFAEVKPYVLRFLLNLVPFCYRVMENGRSEQRESDWLPELVMAGFDIVDGDVVKKNNPSATELNQIEKALTCEQNRYGYGFEMFDEWFSQMDDNSAYQICRSYSLGQLNILGKLSLADQAALAFGHEEDAKRLRSVCREMLDDMRFFLPPEVYDSWNRGEQG